MISVKRILLFTIFAIGLVSLSLFDSSIVTPLRGLIFLAVGFFVTGFSIVSLLKNKSKTFIENLSLGLGVSIVLNILLGLLFSFLKFKFSILNLNDLSFRYFYLCFILLFSSLMLFYRSGISDLYNKVFSKRGLLFLILPFVLTLQLIGTLALNDFGNNAVIIAFLLSCSVVFSFLWCFANKLSDTYLALSVLVLSLGLLFSYSLRSNYLVGWDIHQEFRVFQITKELGYWSRDNYASAYNATLSISLLPVIMQSISHIPDLYIYKLIYPTIFSFTIIFIYFLARNFISKRSSLLATVFFIVQFPFMQQMPALNRQEIALFFFAMMVYCIYKYSTSTKEKAVTFIFSAVGIVLSHYSTAYITDALIGGVWGLSLASNIFIFSINKLFKKTFAYFDRSVKLWMVLVLLALIIGWYGVFTGVSNDLTNTITKAIGNMSNANAQEVKSEQARYAIWGASGEVTQDEISRYGKNILVEYNKDKPWYTYYPDEIVKRYPVFIKYPKTIPVKSKFAESVTIFLTSFSQKVLKVSLGLGTAILFLFVSRKQTKTKTEVATLSLVGIGLLLSLTFVPYLSVAYNFERLYQQLLVFLGIPIVLGITFIPKIPVQIKSGFVLALMIIYFNQSNGIFAQFFGGPATLNINNFGEDYDRFYVSIPETTAARWLVKVSDQESSISLDQYSWLRFVSSTKRQVNVLSDLVPSVIPMGGYVYASRTNITQLTTRRSYLSRALVTNFPSEFLNENKNLIYSSKYAQIYK